MCCFDCANISNPNAEEDNNIIAHDHRGIIETVACYDTSKFIRVQDEDRFTQVDVLSALKINAGCTKDDFDSVEKTYGLTYCPTGVLWNPELRGIVRPSTNRHDPAHCLLSNGVCLLEINLLLRAFDAEASPHPKIRFAHLRAIHP